jgi:hypothetical protein
VLRAKERGPITFPFVVFTFELAVESIKELVTMSHMKHHDTKREITTQKIKK